jgi:hypothetical protein
MSLIIYLSISRQFNFHLLFDFLPILRLGSVESGLLICSTPVICVSGYVITLPLRYRFRRFCVWHSFLLVLS